MLEITINSGHATPDWTAYQPLIVGLGAVILGLIANTLLEWSKRRMDRKGDAKGLRAALLGELQANRQGLDDRIENSNKSEHDSSGTLLIPINNHVHIYNENISKLGILNPNEILSVIKCYDFLIGTPKNFGFLGKICGDDYNRWLEVDSKFKNLVIQMDVDSIAHLDEAIATLSDNQKRR